MSIGRMAFRLYACVVSQTVLVISLSTPRNVVHTITSPLRRSLHTRSLTLDCQRVSSGSSHRKLSGFLHPLGPLPSNKPTLILASPGIVVALRLALFYTVTWFTDRSLELAHIPSAHLSSTRLVCCSSDTEHPTSALPVLTRDYSQFPYWKHCKYGAPTSSPFQSAQPFLTSVSSHPLLRPGHYDGLRAIFHWLSPLHPSRSVHSVG